MYDKIEKELGFTIPKTMRNDYLANTEYEYKNLKFLDTLGEGAFGKVLKAEAQGLKCPQGSQIVAVKMCRGLLRTGVCLVLSVMFWYGSMLQWRNQLDYSYSCGKGIILISGCIFSCCSCYFCSTSKVINVPNQDLF